MQRGVRKWVRRRRAALCRGRVGEVGWREACRLGRAAEAQGGRGRRNDAPSKSAPASRKASLQLAPPARRSCEKTKLPRAPPPSVTTVPAGTRLLSFAIVARLTGHHDPLAAVGRVVDACRGVGGERGYGALLAGRTLLPFDVARSSAWCANNAAQVRSWLPGPRPAANLRLAVCHAAPHRWGAWFVASAELRPGDAV